jgi:hypothetical protein
MQQAWDGACDYTGTYQMTTWCNFYDKILLSSKVSSGHLVSRYALHILNCVNHPFTATIGNLCLGRINNNIP